MSLPLTGAGPSLAALEFLFRDEFTTTESAPLTSPRTAEPGPGTLTVVENDGTLAINGGKLVNTTQATSTAGDLGVYTADLGAGLGKAALATLTPLSTNQVKLEIGFSSSGAARGIRRAFYFNNNRRVQAFINGTSFNVENWFEDTEYQIAVILRNVGCYLVIKGGAFSGWTSVWVDDSFQNAANYLGVSFTDNTASIDYLRVADLPEPFDTEYGLATNRVASPGVGETTTSEADALIEYTWTAATGETLELSVRRVDDDNRWIIRGSQAGSTVKLIKEDATVETEVASAAQTWTDSTDYRIVVIQDGTDIVVYIGNTQKISYSSAIFQPTATGVKVSHAGSNLIAWPRVLSGTAKSVLDQYSA